MSAVDKTAFNKAGNLLVKAIDQIDPYCRDLNHFFEEFDVYDGRSFEPWMVVEIMQFKVKPEDLNPLLKESAKVPNAQPNEILYTILFDCIVKASDCPSRYSSSKHKP